MSADGTTPHNRPPVTDWLTDWDHLDPRWTSDPVPIWDEIRKSECPVAHTDRFMGAYLPVRYKDIRDIAYDTEHFSSRNVLIRDNPPPVSGGGAPPITSDPPRHRPARMALLPPFTPAEVEKLVPLTRSICNELLDAIVGRETCDAAVEYAQHIPVRVIAHMLGIPAEDGEQFRVWIHQIAEQGVTDAEVTDRAFAEMTEYFRGFLDKRRAAPGDDLISYLTRQTYTDGSPFKDNHVLGSVRLLLVAGIDTTWSSIGSSLWHLSRTPADRDRLVREPQLIPTSVEEF
ncbi:MAG: cytochrome P450, partial [Parvularculaceae bacterium]|nr:cytochrome P450 [Parvularculaceae bacterium]